MQCWLLCAERGNCLANYERKHECDNNSDCCEISFKVIGCFEKVEV